MLLSAAMSQKSGEKQINIQQKPPVVVVLGHVDHGKSSILDYIRESNIVEKEAGGITQHIGAYGIEYNAKKITFIDTPGHEAFGAMRARGAKVADIAILVVAADDGVKNQTKEAIKHINKAKLPFIVAINKMDLPIIDVEKVKRELLQNDVKIESMGGEVPSVEVSAKTGKNIDDLLELILLIAEMEGIKGVIDGPAEGVVIETRMDPQRGSTATLLIRGGVLKKDDIVATPSTFGKVKVLEDFKGGPIDEAGLSAPVTVIGFDSVPRIGENWKCFTSAKSAKEYIDKEKINKEPKIISTIEPGKKVLNLILKADVLGSLEAVEGVLSDLPQENIVLRILKSEVGEINESDVRLGISSNAKIIGFRVKTNKLADSLITREKIKAMNFEVIYELVQKIRQLMEKSLEAKTVRNDLGKAKALAIFRTEKNRQIVGAKIIEGEIKKGALIEVQRIVGEEEQIIGKGKIVNLQINEKNVDKLAKGGQCGILYEGDAKVQEGDILIVYQKETKKGDL